MAAKTVPWRRILRNGSCYALLVGLTGTLGLPDGLFLALAAMTVLEVNLGDGVLAGRQRVLATAVGAAVVVLVMGGLRLQGPPGALLAFLLLRLVIYAFHLEGGLVVGGHVLAGSLGHHLDTWSGYVFWRSLQTVAGVLVGLVLAGRVLPSRNRDLWLTGLKEWLSGMATAVATTAADLGSGSAPAGPQGPPASFEPVRRQRDALERLATASLPEAGTEAIARRWRCIQERQLFLGVALLRALADLQADLRAAAATAGGPGDRPAPGPAADPALRAAMAAVLRAAAACLERLARERTPETVGAGPLQGALLRLLEIAARQNALEGEAPGTPAADDEGVPRTEPEGAAGGPAAGDHRILELVRLVGLYTLALTGNDQPLPVRQATG